MHIDGHEQPTAGVNDSEVSTLIQQIRRRISPRHSSTKLLGKAGWIGIFGFEDFPMNPASNSCPLPKSVVWCIAVDAVRQIFRPFGPISPATPISPPSGPATGSSNGFYLECNFLAGIRKPGIDS
jgi:hypothetical protein